MTEIRRLAIVNRGEPAMRVLAAVAELNRDRAASQITTIALYTEPDARAWFVREADEAIPLGSATYVDPADPHASSDPAYTVNLVPQFLQPTLTVDPSAGGATSVLFALKVEELFQ